jgi:RNA-dependent RNA polymerase
LPPAKLRKVSIRSTDCAAARTRSGASAVNITPTTGTKPVSKVSPTLGAKPASSSDAFSLLYVFRGKHGLHLEPYTICHVADVQAELDRLKIARGVQWELARGFKSGSWTLDGIKAKLGRLVGSNAEVAPKVHAIMLGEPPRVCTEHEMALWYFHPFAHFRPTLTACNREELDREAKATFENKSRGLGLMEGEFEGVSDWFGGKVQLTIRLLDAGEDKVPNVRLEPLQMTRSHHLARELGSVSVIALRDDKDGALVKQWAGHKFILWGRVYIALPPKGSKVYLIETNEDYDRTPQEWCADIRRKSYDDYIRNNNPMELNANQVCVYFGTFKFHHN